MVVEFRVVEHEGTEGPWFSYTDFWGETIVELFPQQMAELRARFLADQTEHGILRTQVRNRHGQFMSLQMRIRRICR